jgi:hypothetical protein
MELQYQMGQQSHHSVLNALEYQNQRSVALLPILKKISDEGQLLQFCLEQPIFL